MYTRFLQSSPKLAPFDFYLQTKLQVPTRDDSKHREPAQELEQHKYRMKKQIETRYLFYRSSDSFGSYSPLRGLRTTQRRSALEGTMKITLAGVFSNSFSSFH